MVFRGALKKLTGNINEPASPYGIIAGFDAIIGNPPYGALFTSDEVSYFKSLYQTAVWRGESYLLFIERGLKLLRQSGMLGFIIPDTILNLGFTQPTRELLLRNSRIKEIINLPSKVFSSATVDTVILTAEKAGFVEKYHDSNVLIKLFRKNESLTSIDQPQKEYFTKTETWYGRGSFNIQTDESENVLLMKIEEGRKTIADIAGMYSGIKVYSVGRGTPVQTEIIRKTKPYTSDNKQDKDWSPFFDGKHIGRYAIYWDQNNWVKYGQNLAEPRKQENFLGKKILIRKITGKTLIAAYVPYDSYCNTLLHVLKTKDSRYSYPDILGILNSTLIGWYFRKRFQISDSDTFPQIMIRDILQFPVPEFEPAIFSELDKLVEQVIVLNENLKLNRLQTETEQIKSHLQHCEAKIDELVYGLYGLTEEEVRIVEGEN